MMSRLRIVVVTAIAGVAAATDPVAAQRQMENLGRGLVAVNQGDGKVFVSWRLLGTDPDEIAFNLYGSRAGGPAVVVNDRPITRCTWFVDTHAEPNQDSRYFVRPMLKGEEQEAAAVFVLKANTPVHQYLSIPLQTPVGYSPNDASVGDLEGDGEYEIVLHQVGRGRDNAQSGLTTEPIIQAYRLDGTCLWSIKLGRNVREGAHYTQFMVYDLDGDGRAEIVCKTADGTTDGQGKVIGDPNANYVNGSGKILDGPEFLTVFDGRTGQALATTDYVPPRGGNGSGWGDSSGNRCDRFLACVAYLDGVRPSVVMCRGYYTRAVLAAWNWREGQLTRVWTFDTDDGAPGHEAYRGQGNHNLSVGDVDGDGKDEIVYGACCIDHDGKGLYSTGWGHGDAIHVSDLDPDRPGLEVFQPHERPSPIVGAEFRDARTGELLWGKPSTDDNGRGMSGDIDPRYRGYECWSSANRELFNCKGEKISDTKPRSCNFKVWWDGDPLCELLDRNVITKWNWMDGTEATLLTAEGCTSNNGSKATPCLCADLFGDWREEVVWKTQDGQELRIHTTTAPTDLRIHTLMHDPVYRLAVAWQNVAYNQPAHTGFYLGDGMASPPRPAILTTGGSEVKKVGR